MKVVVIGAGNVGFTVADTLSSVHDVLVVESNEKRANTVKDLLNVSVLKEDGTNPKILKEILERNDVNTLISTLGGDDANLFVCMIAKSIKPSLRTVARVRHPDFMIKTESGMSIGADQIVSPEQITAKKLAILSLLENAVDYEQMDSLGLAMATFMVTKEHTDMIGKVVIDLQIPDECTVMTIYRNNSVIIFNETTELHSGDSICVLGSPAGLEKFNKMMGYPHEAKEIVVLGGGVIGTQTAKILESQKRYVKIVEMNEERCRRLSKEFDSVLVVNANAVDPYTLRSENVGRADVVISATDSDEKNLLACLMTMEMGVKKVISRYTMREYEDVFQFTGINISVGYHLVVANEITKTLITDERSILRMKHEEEMFFSVAVKGGTKTVGFRVGDLRLPEGARIVCVIRGNEKIYPRMDTMLKENDKVLLFTYKTNLSKLGSIFETDISKT